MSSYTIDYGKLEGKEKQDRAIADIIDYVGKERFDLINEECRKVIQSGATISFDEFAFTMSFAGVRGYPCKAWFEYLTTN